MKVEPTDSSAGRGGNVKDDVEAPSLGSRVECHVPYGASWVL